MPAPGIQMPDESQIPHGPARELLQFLHDLKEASGGASVRVIETEARRLGRRLQKDKVAALLHGRMLRNEAAVLLLTEILSVRIDRHKSQLPSDLNRARDLLRVLRDSDDVPQKTPSNGYAGLSLLPVMGGNHALHFAHAAFFRSTSTARQDSPHFNVLQGAFALVATSFDSTTTGRRVFSSRFQTEVRDLLEVKYVRRDSHHFSAREQWHPTFWVVWGPITGPSPDSIIALEVHDRGAVAVYFRENTPNGTAAEAFGWWINGAATLAHHVHAALGSSGMADAASIIDRAGLVETTTDRRGSRRSRNDQPEGQLHPLEYKFGPHPGFVRVSATHLPLWNGGDDGDVNEAARTLGGKTTTSLAVPALHEDAVRAKLIWLEARDRLAHGRRD